jgi:YVTN family beta-propeller protein
VGCEDEDCARLEINAAKQMNTRVHAERQPRRENVRKIIIFAMMRMERTLAIYEHEYSSRGSARTNPERRRAMCLVLATILLLPSISAQSAAPVPAASTRLLNRTAIVYCSLTDKIYVVNEGKNLVSVIKRDGTVTAVSVGSHPQAVAVSEATGKVYVANSEDPSISIVDGVTDRVIATVPLHSRPYVIAIDQKAHIVYVPGSSVAINDNTNATIADSLGDADAILVDESHRQFLIMGYEGDSITLFNLGNHSSRKLGAGGFHLWGLAQFNDTIFVTHVQDASAAAINIDTGASEEIRTGAMPCAIAIDSNAGEAYVANYRDGSVTVVGLRSHQVTGTVHVGGRPQAIDVDQEEGKIYVADTLNRTITVFDARTYRVSGTFKVDEPPFALLVDKPTHTLYAATLGAKGFIRFHV